MGTVVPLSASLRTAGARSLGRPRPGKRAKAAFEGAPLESLADVALAARFRQWRGASGRRYICSIFPVRAGEPLGGLPEFDGAVVIAAACGAAGLRRVAVFTSCWRDEAFCGDPDAVAAALRCGACEWHLHLLADNGPAQRAALADLAL